MYDIRREQLRQERAFLVGLSLGGDPVRIIKWKEMFDMLEQALDEAEDVANAIESIVLKHA